MTTARTPTRTSAPSPSAVDPRDDDPMPDILTSSGASNTTAMHLSTPKPSGNEVLEEIGGVTHDASHKCSTLFLRVLWTSITKHADELETHRRPRGPDPHVCQRLRGPERAEVRRARGRRCSGRRPKRRR
jgi:hypothetical protein